VPSCPNGHFSTEDAAFCGICGSPVVHERIDSPDAATPLLVSPPAPSAWAGSDQATATATAPGEAFQSAGWPAPGPDPVTSAFTSHGQPSSQHLAGGTGGDDGLRGYGGPPRARRRHRWLAVTAGSAIILLAGGGAAYAFLGHHSPGPAPHGQSSKRAQRPTAGTTIPSATTPSNTDTPSAGPSASPGPVATGAAGWTYPKFVDQQAFNNGDTLSGLSCPSAAQCFAADNGGNVLQANAQTAWGVVHTDSAAGLNSISCASVKFCVGVDSSGNAVVLSSGIWSDPIAIDTDTGLSDVSCASASFCVAVDDYGHAFSYTGVVTHWSRAIVDNNSGLTSVSCPSATFCAAVDSSGYAFIDSHGTWDSGTQLDTSYGFTQVSCATSGFCMAVDGNGSFAMFSSGHWTQGSVGSAAIKVSCPANGYCVAVDNAGGFSVYQKGAWSSVVKIDGNNTFSGLSCSAVATCAAADSNNNVLSYGSATQ
jgi:hypothetical protein